MSDSSTGMKPPAPTPAPAPGNTGIVPPGTAPAPSPAPAPAQPIVGYQGNHYTPTTNYGYTGKEQSILNGIAPEFDRDMFNKFRLPGNGGGGRGAGGPQAPNPQQFARSYMQGLSPQQAVAFAQLNPQQQQAQLMNAMSQTWAAPDQNGQQHGYMVTDPATGQQKFMSTGLYSQVYGSPSQGAHWQPYADQWAQSTGGAAFIK